MSTEPGTPNQSGTGPDDGASADEGAADAGATPNAGEDGTGDVAGGDRPVAISKDTQFAILKNRRRRDILCYLREHGGESTLSDLAEFIAAKENGVERRLLSSDERKRVYIGLYQCHLPKMDDARIVDFDKRSGGVTLRAEADQLFGYIDDPVGGATDDAAPPSPSPIGLRVRLAAGWAALALVALSFVVPGVEAAGTVGVVVAGAFAAVETADALLARRADGEGAVGDGDGDGDAAPATPGRDATDG